MPRALLAVLPTLSPTTAFGCPHSSPAPPLESAETLCCLPTSKAKGLCIYRERPRKRTLNSSSLSIPPPTSAVAGTLDGVVASKVLCELERPTRVDPFHRVGHSVSHSKGFAQLPASAPVRVRPLYY